MFFEVIARIFSLLAIPLTLFSLYKTYQLVRKEQPSNQMTYVIGIGMSLVMMFLNLITLSLATKPGWFVFAGFMLLVTGAGFGLAWSFTSKFSPSDGVILVKRSGLYLLFWALSYVLTQLLATFTLANIVAAGLATMFFTTGSTIGMNANMIIRQNKVKKSLLPETGRR